MLRRKEILCRRLLSSKVFHRAKEPRKVVSGDGCWLIDEDGRRYLDASCGAAVSCLGHSDIEVRDAVKGQIDTLAYAHTSFFTSGVMEDLAEELVGTTGRKVYFTSGGSESIETALKLARQYFVELGEGQRHRVISRRLSYHGNTLGALAIGGNPIRKQIFAPLLNASNVSHISPCYPYRHQADAESLDMYGKRIALELEQKILRHGPDTVMAFVAETLVGSSAGALTPVPGYFQKIRNICSKYGILLILDEVMCGMGRTGTLHAYEQELGLQPDLLCIAKGLGAGYQPIGAVLASQSIFSSFSSPHHFQHGHTYIGHATACAAALVVQRKLPTLLPSVQSSGAYLFQALQSRFADHPYVGDIRGRGLFYALEFVTNRSTKAPLVATSSSGGTAAPTLSFAAILKAVALHSHGLLCYPMPGTSFSPLYTSGDHVLIAPPFIISHSEIDYLVDRLARAIDESLDMYFAAG